MEMLLKRWSIIWQKYYLYFNSLTFVKKFSFSLGFAVLTGVSAQIYVPLPFTPVPFTAQVFTVLLAGVLLGKNFGPLSQLIYLAAGMSGVGWFFASGAGLMRHTTGYIIGFVIAAHIIGAFTERNSSVKSMYTAMLLGVLTILLCGSVWLSAFLRISFGQALTIGLAPFIPLDLLKALAAGKIAGSIIKNR